MAELPPPSEAPIGDDCGSCDRAFDNLWTCLSAHARAAGGPLLLFRAAAALPAAAAAAQ